VKYLLDTNTCIEYLRGRNARVVDRLDGKGPAEVCLCSVVVAELRFGALRSRDPVRNEELLDVFVKEFDSLPFDDDAARHYAQIRQDLASRGQLIGPNDLLIAAIARNAGLTIVTHNSAEFTRVDDLAVEDWTV
jgi:tRNA(fMet)-specific endonuclease VapC